MNDLNEKIKDMDLDILQYKRKSEESEAKVSHLKQLFETVRNERNIASKNLVEATVSDTISHFTLNLILTLTVRILS